MRIKRFPIVDGHVVLIPLSRGYVATIDIDDAPLGMYQWTAKVGRTVCHAYRKDANNKVIYLHREVAARAGISLIAQIDHINGDGLFNTRCNLRSATAAQNILNRGKYSSNTSGIKGVSWEKGRSLWRADIAIGGRSRFLGHFASTEEAARAYAEACAELHGDFGRIQ